MITYHQLRTFLAVARTGSLTKAARELGASQPTVSLQLQALRKSLGNPLLERRGNQFHLTVAGEKLRQYAEGALEGLHLLRQEMDVLKGSLAGPLHVGATFTVSRYVLPTALYRFREQFPEVELQLHIDVPPDHLFRDVLAKTLDVACYVRVRTPPELTVEPICGEELIVIASPRHPLAGRPRVSPQELSQRPFIASGVVRFKELAEMELRTAGVTPLVVAEGQHHDAVKKLVERNLGYSLVIKSTVAEELASGRLVPLNLDGSPFPSEVVVAFRPRPVSPVIQEFIRFVRAELVSTRAVGDAHTAGRSRRRGREPHRGRPKKG